MNDNNIADFEFFLPSRFWVSSSCSSGSGLVYSSYFSLFSFIWSWYSSSVFSTSFISFSKMLLSWFLIYCWKSTYALLRYVCGLCSIISFFFSELTFYDIFFIFFSGDAHFDFELLLEIDFDFSAEVILLLVDSPSLEDDESPLLDDDSSIAFTFSFCYGFSWVLPVVFSSWAFGAF